MRRRKTRSEPEALGRLVPRVMRDLGFDQAARTLRLAERWEEAVGPEIARHCRPSALRAHVLEATVDSSVWCQQLKLRTPELLEALRRVLGEAAPTEIRLRVGP